LFATVNKRIGTEAYEALAARCHEHMQQCGGPQNYEGRLREKPHFQQQISHGAHRNPGYAGTLLRMASQYLTQVVRRVFRIRFWKNLLRGLAGGISSSNQLNACLSRLGNYLSLPLNCQARIRALEKGYPVLSHVRPHLIKSGLIPHSRD
jgi:hypothetical protein